MFSLSEIVEIKTYISILPSFHLSQNSLFLIITEKFTIFTIIIDGNNPTAVDSSATVVYRVR